MKNIFTLVVLFFVFQIPKITAQCPPPGFPEPGNTCPEAPILCPDLNGYCSTVNNNNVQQPFPGCNVNVLNNDEWFAFFAGTTTIEIEVVPSNCSQSGNMGLQGGIYSSCNNQAANIMDVQCACTEDPFTLFSTNYVVGEIYWFVLDGCAGNVCDYTINVLQGSTVGVAPDDPGPITGPDTVCINSLESYSVDPVNAATIYNWEITPPIGTVNGEGDDIHISWSSSGTAEVCLTVENLCFANNTPSCMTVEVLPEPTAQISGSGELCAGGSASIDIQVDFTGAAPWQFVYTINGDLQPPITTSENPYILTVTDPGTYALVSVNSWEDDCPGTVSGSAEITEVNVDVTASVEDATCGQSNGSIDISYSGGQSPYTFMWSNGETTEDITDLAPGLYSVTVIDANGCEGKLDIDVGDEPNEPTVTDATVNSECGQANGDIDITVTGGESPYTYLWDTGATTEDLDDVEAGSYTVTVTGADGCTQVHTVNLGNDDPPIDISADITPNTTCQPIAGNGGITITISPQPAPGGGTYSINWSTGDVDVTTLSDLAPGSYSVTVTTGTSCEGIATFNIPDEPDEPSLNATTDPSECGLENGSIDVSVSGGVPPYTFSWSNGDTTEDLDDVGQGNYSVTVTAANGCTDDLSIELTNDNPPITISSTIEPNTTCPPSQADGSISISISPQPAPGNGNYDITWSNGGSGTSQTDLPPGSYSVTVSAGGECSQTATFNVPDEPNEPNINSNVTPATCGLDDGSISISISGGVSPYDILWSNGETTTPLTNIPGGSYGVTVTGANGCSTEAQISVPDNPINFTITPTIEPNTSCIPPSNGSISITVTPPGNYTYMWGNGETTTEIIDQLNGSYSVTVSAGGTCTQVANFTIPLQPVSPILNPNVEPATCGQDDGEVTVIISGGINPFTYQWSNGATTPNLPNVPGGSYSVTVTGANGCTSSTSVNVPNEDIPITITETITPNTSCLPPGNGAISVSINPPDATILWSNGSTSPSLTDLAPGSYSVTVSAGGDCEETATFTVPDDSEVPQLNAIPDPTICNQENGGVTLNVIGGLAPLQFQWSNGATTQNLTDIPSGTYSVTVTTVAGCSAQTNVTVPNNDIAFTLNGFPTGNTSCTFPNGSIQLNVNPPPLSNYTFQWSNFETTPYLIDVAAGTYSVTVSAGGTCTQVATYEVFDFAFPPNVSASASAAICGQDNGAVDLTVEGNNPPFQFDWSNGATTEDLSDVPAGTYSVTVTDAFGCTATTSATVNSNSVAINLTGTPSANVSCQSANGGINLNISPSGTYDIIWSNGETTEDLSNLAAGTYSVTVSAGGNCSAEASYTVVNDTEDPEISQTVTGAICGEANGGIDLSVSGSTTPYTFIWSNGETTEDITDLLPGDYSVTVTGADGCVAEATFNVPNNSSSFTIDGIISPLTSCIAGNGSINLSITPAGTYDIAWSNGETTEDLSNLDAGTYTVTVTESGSCEATASFVIEDETSFPTTSQSVTEELCGQENGAVDLTVNGTSTPFEYVWSSGETTEDLSDIPAGTYTVTVTGANGCTATTTATVPDNSINFSVSGTPAANTSCDVNNGEINLNVTPAGTYTYNWSNGATTEDITALAGGSYSVTVSAGGECTSVANFTVPSTTADPVLAQAINPAVCGEATGGIDLDVTAGEAPFEFEWSNGSTSEDIDDVLSGDYSVTVTGANGCVVTGNFTVPNNSIVLTVDGTTIANTSCDNVNGSVNISVTPSGTYDYEWSNGMTTEDLSDLPPGNYTVTVTEGQNCTAEATFIVGNDTNAPDITPDISAATCGEDNGGIDLLPTGGTIPYSFEWSNGETTEDITDLLPGNYDVTVTGDDGCSNTGSYVVPDDPIDITIDATPAANTSCDNVNGQIDLTLSPTGTYDIIWSNGQTNEDLTGLPSGNYSVTVTLGENCTAEEAINVGNDTNAPNLTDDITSAICGQATGGIDLSPVGGTMPYTFEWSNGATTEDLTDVLPGDYDVTVTGDDGCSNTGSYSVPDDMVNIQLSGDETPNTFCENGNGTIDLNITPSATYDIEWSNGEITEDLSDLPAGDYEVTVSAGGTCTATATFTIADEPDVPTLSDDITASICDQPDGGIDIEVMGGAMPFEYEWSNGETTQDLTNVTSGDYSVTVTSANGCSVMADYSVPNNSNTFTMSGTAAPNTLCGDANGSIDLTITPAGAYGIEWSNGETTEDLTDLPPGDYTVTVSDGGTCTASQTFTVDNTAPTVDVAGVPTDILCFGETTGAIDLTASGGVEPYVFDWSPAISGSPEDPVNLAAGPYSVTVTDASGCSGTASFDLSQPVDAVQISCSQTSSVSAPGNSDGMAGVSISGGTAPYTVTWSPGGSQSGVAAGDFAIQNLAEGGYDVTVVDANGCETNCNFLITSTDCEVEASLAATPTEILDCVVESITLLGSSTGADDPTYEWFLGGVSIGMNQSLTVNEGGDYVLIVTDAVTGCADTTNVVISDNTDFPPLFVDPAEDLNCFTTEVTISGGSPVQNVDFTWGTIVGTDTTLIGSGDNTMVTEPGTYWLFGEADNGCQNGISVTVDGDFSTPNADAGISFTIGCDSGGTYTLDGTASTGSGTLTFAWETIGGLFANGQNTATPSILEAGTYTLTVTQSSNGCTDEASVEIDTDGPQVDPQTIDPDCYGDDGALILQNVEGGTPPYQYSIDGGATFTDQNVFFGLPAGEYEIVVVDEIGCDDEDVVSIVQPDSFYVIIAEPVVTVQIGDSYQINTQVSVPIGQIESVSWNPSTYLDCADCLDPLATPEQSTNYLVTVVDSNGCEDTAPLLLVVNKDVNIYVPNAFSPNGDGTNDVFMIYANDDQVVEIKSFLVFSRWGESVFEYYDFVPNNPAYGWDGMHRGEPLNPAVFAWFAEVELVDGSTILLEGDVTLMK